MAKKKTTRKTPPDSLIPAERIERNILLIRGENVMLDSDLAALYEVETRVLNQAVKRNLDRFPEDFMLQLTEDEAEALRSQTVTLKTGRGRHRKYRPYAFTEQGVAMLSSVLHSERAVNVLRQRLAQPLPGIGACSDFEPELCYGRHQGPPAHDARQAAVLLLLYPGADSWHLPLTVRPESLSAHGGQVSLPGGLIEPGETIEQAALRECCEELGDTGDDVQLLGNLSPLYVFASNFLVTPCVAWSPTRPRFEPNSAEVANLLEPSLVDLLNPDRRGSHSIIRRGVQFRVPHILYDGYKIWGATSVILAEFLQIVNELTPEARAAWRR